MKSTTRAFAAALLAGGVLATSAQAGTMKSWEYEQEHLARAKDHKNVGMIQADNGAWLGSGTLIHPEWVLTVAHVVDGASSLTFHMGDQITQLSPGRVVTADAWYVPTTWSWDLFAGNDIALVKLSEPVTNVTPAQLFDRDVYGSENKRGVMISGYGNTGTGLTGQLFLDGNRRAGTNTIRGFFEDLVSHERILEHRFDVELTNLDYTGPHPPKEDFESPRGLEYDAAQGDSGGPVFVHSGVLDSDAADDKIIGLTSFGFHRYDPLGKISSFTGSGGSTAVSPWLEWIDWVMTGGVGPAPAIDGALEGFDGMPLRTPEEALLLAQRQGESAAKYLKDTLELDFVPIINGDFGYFTGWGTVPIPEPTTLTLLAVGGLGLLRRPRRCA